MGGGGGGGYTGGIKGIDELTDIARQEIDQCQAASKVCNIFVPHAWDYEDEYKRLLNLLDGVPGFEYKDYSVPRDDPIHARSAAELERALQEQISHAAVVIVPAGMYAAHREWIETEIRIAKAMRKPIVGVYPWGSKVMPKIVSENADEIVGWNRESIVGAIQRLRCADGK